MLIAFSRMIGGALAVYAAVSVVTIAAYAVDKRRARTNGRRIPERVLHLLELLGGWPGALFAQHLLRHKNRKLRYQFVFWLIPLAHGVVWYLVWRR